MNKREKMKNNAYLFGISFIPYVANFTQDELIRVYHWLNSGCDAVHFNEKGWDDRFPPKPKEMQGDNAPYYTVAVMEAIASVVGYKAIYKWHAVNVRRYNEDESEKARSLDERGQLFEDWYELQVQKAVLHPHTTTPIGSFSNYTRAKPKR